MAKEPSVADMIDPAQGFSRFTPRARNIVVAAQNAAGAARNAEISTLHLVLGLLTEPDSLAGRAIVDQGVTLAALHDATTVLLPPAADEMPVLIPFDADAKKALELTFREALRMGHNYVGTEHILLALLEIEPDDGVLQAAGITKPATEGDVRTMLASIAATPAVTDPSCDA